MSKLKIFYGEDPVPGGGGFYWPASPSKRKELLSVKRGHPASYESVYQCRPGTRIGAIFVDGDFTEYVPPQNLATGIADIEVRAFCTQFYEVVSSWDTAFDATTESNYTVGLVAGLLPCNKYHRGEDPLLFGECDPHLDVYLLDLYREKLSWGDLVGAWRRMAMKWSPTRHLVEHRASGISLYQSLSMVGIQVEGVKAIESKRSRIVSGTEAGSVQGWFRQHRVYLPTGAPWVQPYKVELKDFTGEDDANDDQVDATGHLTNYAIQTGGAMSLISSDWSPDTVDEMLVEQATRPEITPAGQFVAAGADVLSWMQVANEMVVDGFAQCCARCTNRENGFCRVQRRLTIELDFCDEFEPVSF